MADASQALEVFLNELDKYLHGNTIGILKDIFQKIEHDLQIRRLNVALGFLICLALLFLLSDSAQFLCNFITFVYPACIIIQAIEQGHVQLDSKKWLTYWVIYNAFIFVEYFLYLESPFMRIYWLMKCLMLSFCFISVPWNGSERTFYLYIHPFLLQHQITIDAYLFWAWDSINKGVPPFVLLFCVYKWGFGFMCNILGFVYPAYASMISLMNDSEAVSRCWLAYWLVYSCIRLPEFVLSIIPLYYPVKFLLLSAYLLEPLAQKALFFHGRGLILCYRPVHSANRLCHHAVHYFLTSHQAPQKVRVKRRASHSPGAKGEQAEIDPLEVCLQLASPMVQAVLDMDVKVELVKKAIKRKLARDGQNFTSAEALLEAVFDLPVSTENEEEGTDVDSPTVHEGISDFFDISHASSSGNYNEVSHEVIEENRQLKEQRLCKICMVEEIGVVFVPCGHLMCCYKCAFELDTCPICRAEIETSIRTYMS